MEGIIATITPWAANFAPRGWQFCQGQLLKISQNNALFSLLGTTYGGDGQTTFGLPDLRSRVALGAGNGGRLGTYALGETGGTESNTLTVQQLAAHSHPFSLAVTLPVNADSAGVPSPQNAFLAPSSTNVYSQSGRDVYYGALSVKQTIGQAGGTAPVPNIQPVLCLNYIICVQGFYPNRP